MRKILFVDRDSQYNSTLSIYLQGYFTVQVTHSSETAWDAIQNWLPDIVLLDEESTHAQPLDVIRNLRNSEQIRHIGVVVLNEGKLHEQEEQLYLRGADVVLERDVKPNVLVLRLSALIQRIDGFQNLQEAHLTLGDVTIHPTSKTVEFAGKKISLTPTQFAILMAFACNPNQVLTRKWMQQNIWKGSHVSLRSIDAQISKLKRVLPSLHERIVNVYGEGYLLMPLKKAA